MNTFLRALLVLVGIVAVGIISIVIFLLIWFPRGEADVTLYQQKIPGTACVILDFDVWYGLDGHLFGRTIVSDIEDFDPFDAQHLPLEFIEIKNNNEIVGTQVWANDYNSRYMDKAQTVYRACGINLNARHLEQSTGGICGGMFYDFDSLFVATDSLILFDLVSSDISKIERNRFAVPLGNIMLYTDSGGFVNQIQAAIIVSKESIEVNGEKKTVVREGNNVKTNEACIRKHILKPKNQIHSATFPDYGFFKPVKAD